MKKARHWKMRVIERAEPHPIPEDPYRALYILSPCGHAKIMGGWKRPVGTRTSCMSCIDKERRDER